MPVKTRAIFLKQSGEKLHGSSLSDKNWNSEAVAKTGTNLARLYLDRDKLHISAITIISGAGNIARGDKLKKQKIAPTHADVIGRAATILNTIIIADALKTHDIPYEIFIASKMCFSDASIETTTYSPEALLKAHQQGKVALIAGGTGDDNVTTDNAVVLYASDYRKVHAGEVVIIKSTQVDGVYEHDPATAPDARRYKTISAKHMYENYDDFKVVDKASLESLIASNLSMHVYSEDSHELSEVLEAGTDHSVGTIITPDSPVPVFY